MSASSSTQISQHRPAVLARTIVLALVAGLSSCVWITEVALEAQPLPGASIDDVKLDAHTTLLKAELLAKDADLDWKDRAGMWAAGSFIESEDKIGVLVILDAKSRVLRYSFSVGNPAGCFKPDQYVQAKDAARRVMLIVGDRGRFKRESRIC